MIYTNINDMLLDVLPPGVFAKLNNEDLKPLYDLAEQIESSFKQTRNILNILITLKSKVHLMVLLLLL